MLILSLNVLSGYCWRFLCIINGFLADFWLIFGHKILCLLQFWSWTRLFMEWSKSSSYYGNSKEIVQQHLTFYFGQPKGCTSTVWKTIALPAYSSGETTNPLLLYTQNFLKEDFSSFFRLIFIYIYKLQTIVQHLFCRIPILVSNSTPQTTTSYWDCNSTKRICK